MSVYFGIDMNVHAYNIQSIKEETMDYEGTMRDGSNIRLTFICFIVESEVMYLGDVSLGHQANVNQDGLWIITCKKIRMKNIRKSTAVQIVITT